MTLQPQSKSVYNVAEGPLGTPKGAYDRSQMPTARQYIGSASDSGLIYIFGGQDSNSNVLDTVEEYDPDTDTWTVVSPLNTARQHFGVAVSNGYIYIIGGYDGTNALSSVEKYDPENDTYTIVASTNETRQGPGAAAANGYLYVFGGADTKASTEKYDTSSDSWTNVGSLNQGRRNLFGASTSNGVFALGGYNSGTLDTAEILDPSTDSWTTIASMNAKRNYGRAAVVNDTIYATGRNDQPEFYDYSNDTWQFVDYSVTDTLSGHAAAGVGDYFYTIGGYNGSSVSNGTRKHYISDEYEDVLTASTDVLVAIEGDSGNLLNRSTGINKNTNFAKDGETLAVLLESQDRVFKVT